MKQHPIQIDKEQERQAKELAKVWGLPKQRYMSKVLSRCLERVYQQVIMGAAEANNGMEKTKKDAGKN
jgi:hypothetical protein